MADAEPRVKRAQYLFGTICSVEVTAPKLAAAQQAVGAAFAELARLQRLLSPFEPDSELSRLNHRAHSGPHRLSPDVQQPLALALEISRRTDGRYDPTIWPVLLLWRGAEQAQRWPAREALADSASAVGWERIMVDECHGTVTFADPRTQLDLSSVAKGYALDSALRAVRRWPISTATLDAGGELLIWRTDSLPVEIGVADPEDRRVVTSTVRVANQAVATSSQGEPHLTIEGTPVGHLFDPRSGEPLQAAVESATVIAPSGMLADALSTAAFLMDAAEVVTWLRGFERTEGAWLVREHAVRSWSTTPQCPLRQRWSV